MVINIRKKFCFDTSSIFLQSFYYWIMLRRVVLASSGVKASWGGEKSRFLSSSLPPLSTSLCRTSSSACFNMSPAASAFRPPIHMRPITSHSMRGTLSGMQSFHSSARVLEEAAVDTAAEKPPLSAKAQRNRSARERERARAKNKRAFHSSARVLEEAAVDTAAEPQLSANTLRNREWRARANAKKRAKAKKLGLGSEAVGTNASTGKAKKKKEKVAFEHRTHGEAGRLIMTEQRLNEILIESEPRLDEMLGASPQPLHNTNMLSRELLTTQPKNTIHNAQKKMLFQQKWQHTAEGPGHDKLFYATLRTTLDKKCMAVTLGDLDNADNTTTIELVNIGAARAKKTAESLAASDLITNLSELGIDIRNPPDVAKLKKTQDEERLKTKIQQSQMILEGLDVSRPIFETQESEHQPSGGGGAWVSKVKFYCRGVPINSSFELGKSKSDAEGRALQSVVGEGGTLEYFVGKPKMDEIRNLIDRSPAGHVAALHVPQLPEEVLDPLIEAIGSYDDHLGRMERHKEAKTRYEREFDRRRISKMQHKEQSASKGRGFSELVSDSTASAMENYENETFEKEELSRAMKVESDPEGKQGQMQSVRDALPIKAIQNDLIEALRERQVVVVSGGTGSGKSTQCPQYILEDAILNQKSGANTRIVVTQPRRIAAISVAERIADERDEDVGNSVGYTVRFNKKSPREAGASIEFVTTGVLLRRLVNDPSLDGISHVMIDEVHERDIDTDFLLVLLRELLTKRPELRVILMSATLDAESFGKYFGDGDPANPVPVMSVPTKPRHPVEVIHLEDMACEGETESFKAEIPAHIQDLSQSLLRHHDQQLQLELEEALAEDKAALKLEARSIAEDEGNLTLDPDSDSDGSDGEDELSSQSSPSTRIEALRRAVSMRGGPQSSRTSGNRRTLSDKRETSEITTKLLAKLAQHVAQVETDAGRKGSILCFLPGLDEIKGAMKILEDESNPSLKARMKILPLHSTIPQEDQQKVFIPAADGTVKVILATNIAESSVTIDDVLAVVDGGLVRELNYSAERAMSEMVTVPTSKASATQRLGRAGRVAPGKCYRIYSRGQHTTMLERPMPEIQRTALEATCLNTCTMTDSPVAEFLSRAMDPPKDDAVAHAMDRLNKLGAITVHPASTGGESLTPLGHCLSRLPLDPATGRMLIMGCVMQCLDPVLTAAACSGSKSLFYTPPGMREEQRKARQAFSKHSDMMASVQAYNQYQSILNEEGWGVAREWASDNFISIGAISSVHSIRSQLINELHRIGLVQNFDLGRSRGRKREFHPDAYVNRNAGVESLYSAIWASGTPDNLASRRQLGNFGTLRSRTENHAGLHPSSVAYHRKPPKERNTHLPPWFFYREMVLSSQVFLRDCTALTPEQILLFGGYSLDSNLDDQGSRGQRVLDDWIIVDGHCDDTLDVLSTARSEINAALDLKVMNPRRPLPEFQQSVIDAVCDCFDELDQTR